jgi:hypothetical protein
MKGQKPPSILLLFLLAGALVYAFSSQTQPAAATTDSVDNTTAATTYHVAPGGTDHPNCGSAQNPCATIQYAVEKAASGDTIKVTAGTYTYTNASQRCQSWYGTTGVVCVDRKHLSILGGYTSSNWHTPNPSANRTIIDGQHNHRGVFVLQTLVAPTSLHMEGFTIRNGHGRSIPARGGDDAIFAFGGGMFVDRANLTLRHLRFENNLALGETTTSSYGGAGSGGGLAIHTSANSVIEHVTFHNNKAQGGSGGNRGGFGVGGGLYTFNSTVTGQHLTFTNNQAIGGNSNGSGISQGEKADGQGGAVAAQIDSNMTLRNVTIINNTAGGGNTPHGNSGGAFGGGLFAEQASLVVLDALVSDNVAIGGTGLNQTGSPYSMGGGIATDNSNLTLERAEVINNTARGGDSQQLAGPAGGGGIGIQRLSGNTQSTIRNTIIGANQAVMGNGTDKSAGGGGGGIFLNGASATFYHLTIAGNSLNESHMQGSGMVVISHGAATPGTAQINYTIFANHNMANALHVQAHNPGNQVTLNRGLFDNNTSNASGFGNIAGLTTMISGQASFVNADELNFRIKNDSVARNALNYDTLGEDIDNKRRDNFPDIGASEVMSPQIAYFGAAAVVSGQLNLSWQAINMDGLLNRYVLTVACPAGASPPTEISCGVPTNMGTVTSYQLTGLSNYYAYSFTIKAYDATDNLLTMATATGMPTDLFIFLPTIQK